MKSSDGRLGGHGHGSQPGASASIESSRELLQALEHIPGGFILLTGDLAVTHISRGAARLLHARPEDILGRRMPDLTPPLCEPMLLAAAQRAVSGRSPVSLQEFVPTLSIWAEMHLCPTVSGLTLYLRDITQLKRHQATYQAAVNQAMLGVAIFQDGRVVYANDALAELSGHSTEQLRTLTSADIQSLLRSDLSDDSVPHSSFRIRDGAGRVRWLEALETPIDYERRPATRVVYVDVTDLRQAESAARSSDRRLRSLFDGNIIGIILGTEDRITDANDAFLDIVGYTRADLEANRLNWRAMTPPEFLHLDDRAIQMLLGNGHCPPFEKEYIRKDGSRVPILLGASLVTHEPFEWVCFVMDLTERRQAEAERAALLDEHARARRSAEEHARRIGRLQSVTYALSQALTPADVVDVVVGEGVDALDARGGLVALLTPDRAALTLVRAVGYPAEAVHPWQRIPLSLSVPLTDAVRTGQPVTVESRSELVQRYPLLESSSMADGSTLAFPLIVQGDIIGVMGLSFDRTHNLDASDQAFIVSLSHQCAQALERARLFAEAQQARAAAEAAHARVARLAEASMALAASLDYETTLQTVAHLPLPDFADYCGIYIQDAEGRLQPSALAAADPSKLDAFAELARRHLAFAANLRAVTARVRITGKPALLARLETDELRQAYPDLLPPVEGALEALAPRSAIIAPLLMRGQVQGIMTFARCDPDRRYDERDVELAHELARRAATAVDNARLYRDAQESIRLREAFLSTASREIWTPVAAVQLQERLLLNAARHGSLNTLPHATLVQILESNDEHLSHLAHMVTNLLDVSRIRAGRLELVPQRVDLVQIVREVIEHHAEAADRAGSAITLTAPAVVEGQWDRARIAQVVDNLLSNAITFGNHRPIDITIEGDATTARLSVRDHGLGIAPSRLRYIFDRFGRFEPSVPPLKSGTPGGLGLGLSIAHGLVAAHGGSIDVDSTLGRGSTFIVELPFCFPAED